MVTSQSESILELVQNLPKVGASETSLPKEKLAYQHFDPKHPIIGRFNSGSSSLPAITITIEKHHIEVPMHLRPFV